MLHESAASSSNSEKTHDSDGAGGREVTRLASERLAILQQLWRELGVAPDEQAREQQTLLRDVRGVYDRRLQFYRDEQELTRRRLAVLQREIAHVQWLFRDDAPHEVTTVPGPSSPTRFIGRQQDSDRLCLYALSDVSLVTGKSRPRFATSSRRWK